jgi:hypothetical protein
MDPHSFGAVHTRSIERTRALLEVSGVISYGVQRGDDLTEALSVR